MVVAIVDRLRSLPVAWRVAMALTFLGLAPLLVVVLLTEKSPILPAPRAPALTLHIGDAAMNFVGVLVGATISIVSTMAFARLQERDKRLALAYSLLFRVRRATDEILDHYIQIVHPAELILQSDKDRPKWAAMKGGVGFKTDLIDIPPDELVIFAREQDWETINRLQQLTKSHRAVHANMEEFFKRREAVTTKLHSIAPVKIAGGKFYTEFTPAQMQIVAPDLAILEDLAEQVFALVKRIAIEARDCAQMLGPKLKARLRDERYRGKIEYPTLPI